LITPIRYVKNISYFLKAKMPMDIGPKDGVGIEVPDAPTSIIITNKAQQFLVKERCCLYAIIMGAIEAGDIVSTGSETYEKEFRIAVPRLQLFFSLLMQLGNKSQISRAEAHILLEKTPGLTENDFQYLWGALAKDISAIVEKKKGSGERDFFRRMFGKVFGRKEKESK
jgi:hypothetical protein